MKKLNFKLDDHEAWVLYEILDRVIGSEDIFLTVDEDNNHEYDNELENEAVSLRDKLGELRGIK